VVGGGGGGGGDGGKKKKKNEKVPPTAKGWGKPLSPRSKKKKTSYIQGESKRVYLHSPGGD